MDVPRDDEAFLALLGEVIAVLDAPMPPKSSEDCEVCNYRNRMQEFTAGKTSVTFQGASHHGCTCGSIKRIPHIHQLKRRQMFKSAM